MDNGIYYINDRYHDLFLQLNVFSDMIHLVTLDKENHIRPAMHIYLDRSVNSIQHLVCQRHGAGL
jgi:hypothetical protein